jgi:hypothetical protein
MVLGLVLGTVVTLIQLGIVDAFVYAGSAHANILNAVALFAFIAIGFIFTRIINRAQPKTDKKQLT